MGERDTVPECGGFCDRVPEVGDRFSCQDLDVLVTRVDNHRTCEIKVVRREASGGEITDET